MPVLCLIQRISVMSDTAYISLQLKIATKMGNVGVLKVLVNHGAVVLDRNGCSNLLHKAAKYSRVKVIPYLLEIGVPIEGRRKYSSPLMTAAEKANFETVKLLIECGANLHAYMPDTLTYLISQSMPLIWLSITGEIQVLFDY